MRWGLSPLFNPNEGVSVMLTYLWIGMVWVLAVLATVSCIMVCYHTVAGWFRWRRDRMAIWTAISDLADAGSSLEDEMEERVRPLDRFIQRHYSFVKDGDETVRDLIRTVHRQAELIARLEPNPRPAKVNRIVIGPADLPERYDGVPADTQD